MAGKRKKGADETLTAALARLLEKTILPDLTARAKTPAVAAVLAEQHARERAESRTADTLAEWTPRWLEQVGAAWVLSCVFLRTLEDRGLLRHRRIAGEGAADAEHLFFEIAPSLTARDYLLTAFREVARYPGAEDLLGAGRNPAFRLSPSNEGARALLEFFREHDGSGKGNGSGLRWRFEGTDTRFLGDLYQDLSAAVRERYALLQTPDFVEEFILDLTLEPAIATFGLEETHLIDPTCGSGHFLLGAFERICEQRMRTAPGLDVKEHAWAALGQVHGVDLNPYAVAIAKFRLTLAYLAKVGLGSLAQVPTRLPIEVVVADSLLHGAKETTLRLSELTDEKSAWGDTMYELEDPEAAKRLFNRKYQAIVGNPPYIVPRDKARRDRYREFYTSCHREYALAAPFTERFFQLAADGGFVGLINANSFMKREFGKKLIEEVLPHVDLTRVIDTSGAYIPGHGTPTVLLFGRHQRPGQATIRAVLGKRGEPETPADPRTGKVWSSVAMAYDKPSYEDDFISVVDVSRTSFTKHPWSLGGGGASELKELMEKLSSKRLEEAVNVIGFICMTRADDIYFTPRHVLRNAGIAERYIIDNVEGEVVRDWSIQSPNTTIFPYDKTLQPVSAKEAPAVHRFLWPYRTLLWLRREPNGDHRELGRTWWEWSRFQRERFRTPLSIAFAFVATHNHFVLDHGGKAFKQSAPIIKLPEGATEEDHLALLGYLNSSTACFWMKQVFQPKSSIRDVGEGKGRPEATHYEFTATGLLSLPVPHMTPEQTATLVALAREAIACASGLNEHSALNAGRGIADGEIPRTAIQAYKEQCLRLRRRLVVLQEDIDWLVYALFGIVPAFERSDIFEEAPEQRPFVVGPAVEAWRRRASWIREFPRLQVLEDPLYKRPWLGRQGVFGHGSRSFDEEMRDVREDLIQQATEEVLGRGPSVRSLHALAHELATNERINRVMMIDGVPDSKDMIAAVLVRGDAIPYLAALLYTDAGLETRAQWEHTWSLQRREDAGEKLTEPIPVPEKYDAKDFRDPNYFRLRGKLDVPKERFISYPGAEKDDDQSPLFGWAGWNHIERATALAGLYQERKTEDGWGADRLTPLLAGLLELVPWLKQWHNEMNEEFGERLGDYYERYVDTEARALGLTRDALRAWRPEAKKRKARAKKGG